MEESRRLTSICESPLKIVLMVGGQENEVLWWCDIHCLDSYEDLTPVPLVFCPIWANDQTVGSHQSRRNMTHVRVTKTEITPLIAMLRSKSVRNKLNKLLQLDQGFCLQIDLFVDTFTLLSCRNAGDPWYTHKNVHPSHIRYGRFPTPSLASTPHTRT